MWDDVLTLLSVDLDMKVSHSPRYPCMQSSITLVTWDTPLAPLFSNGPSIYPSIHPSFACLVLFIETLQNAPFYHLQWKLEKGLTHISHLNWGQLCLPGHPLCWRWGGEHLATSETFDCHDWGNATGIWWVEARDTAKNPTMCRMASTPKKCLVENTEVEKPWYGFWTTPRIGRSPTYNLKYHPKSLQKQIILNQESSSPGSYETVVILVSPHSTSERQRTFLLYWWATLAGRG